LHASGQAAFRAHDTGSRAGTHSSPHALKAPHAFEDGETKIAAAGRPVLIVCGELHNIGDLALTAQNIFLARERHCSVAVRTWGAPSAAIDAQLAQWNAASIDGKRPAAFLRCAYASDIVIGGGELIRANNSIFSLLSLLAAVLAARAGKGTVRVRGLGAGPVAGVRALLWKAILRQADRIAVRDRRSADTVRSILPDSHPVLAADMAFLGNRLTSLADGVPGRHPGAIVLAPCVDASEVRALDPAMVAAAVRSARRCWPHAPIVIACHDRRPSMDPAAARWLIDQGQFDAIIFDADGDLAQMQALYRDARIVLTNRLHAGIFALSHCRPLALLDDGNPKLAFLRETFDCASIASPVPEDVDAAIDHAVVADDAKTRRRYAGLSEQAGRNLAVHRPAIFNVKYSPNLGDGIIAECLEGELCRADPRLAPLSIDLAGRTGYSSRNGRFRKPLLTVLEYMPAQVRSRTVPLLLKPLVRLRYAGRWRSWLRRCDSVVIGGGALFADADQNFPIKLAQALDLASRQDLPVAVASVGVSDRWSVQGRRRLAAGLQKARMIGATVRDSDSSAAWRATWGTLGIKPATLAPDPGLLSERQFGRPPRPACEHTRVALCLTAPLALRLHHEGSHGEGQLEAWASVLALRLAERGCEVTLFTNGSPEDRLFRDKVETGLAGRAHIRFAPDFANPGELARFLSGFECVLAHRLHACIVAYSYQVPTLGFAWDRKLRSFFEQTGRERFVLDPRETSPMRAADLAFSAIAEGIDPIVHAQLIEQATVAVHSLAQALIAGAAPR